MESEQGKSAASPAAAAAPKPVPVPGIKAESVADKETRGWLRERALSALLAVGNTPVSIDLVDGDTATAVYRTADADLTQYHVSDLSTPLGRVPQALVRASDTLSLRFKIAPP